MSEVHFISMLACGGLATCAQVRWGALLAKLLRTYRTRITATIPWRPLFQTLRAGYVEGLDTYSGAPLGLG